VTRLAAVDIGTNTVRLLVADEDLLPIERDQRITRLGKGVDASGVLDPASVGRTLEAVAGFVERARELGAERVRVAGTSALRDASNREAFAAAVVDATGVDLEVLDGRTEGRLAYLGATSWLPEGRYVICDIGGGSTELMTMSDEVSLDVGSVRMHERFVRSDPPSADDVSAAHDAISAALRSAIADLGLDGYEQLVGVAGTITTLTALVEGLRTYDPDRVHGARLDVTDVMSWCDRLNRMSVAEVRALGPVEEGRADVLGMGVLILTVVMDVLGAAALVASERDILDGLVLDLAERLA
jgi:exopolyphosphatase/guanosine-5'-triphosphate,3'-diphosphate pyrophosphatase